MSKTIIDSLPDSDLITLSKDNSKIVLHLFGATILSWECGGREVLFLSEKAIFNNKKAIRGGIPLVFPCFGPWDKGPQHGFARIKRWKMECPPAEEAGHMVCQLSLEDDEETRQMWNYQFKLVYTVRLGPISLSMELAVYNTGSSEFEFTTLMHTYFRTPDIAQASVSGLQHLGFVDKLADGQMSTESREFVEVAENYDRVYMHCPSDIIVKGITDKRSDILIKTHNMPDIVVWNPWIEKAKQMADFGDEEYKYMLCVEAGHVSQAVTIGVGKEMKFSQILSML